MRTIALVALLCLSPELVYAQVPTAQVLALTPEQLAQAIAQILAQQDALRQQLAAHDAHLTQHDQQPMWITRFMTSPFGIILTSVASTCVASKCWNHLGGK